MTDLAALREAWDKANERMTATLDEWLLGFIGDCAALIAAQDQRAREQDERIAELEQTVAFYEARLGGR